eukprot:gnl/TRDRNA2_/TRDRNA2_165942_c1_seq2.p1 gnl/TRDRNA2_/TRDRNA2_165942_c1~~gnl/TRDRNA2_/TRDRNA2_165942_c1_seq2.p1  ORF type:complete len:629 (-),score=137.60 gnl/TRDRNA2_/TRDRNA2_165942_c1_seq2:45-1829(-)
MEETGILKEHAQLDRKALDWIFISCKQVPMNLHTKATCLSVDGLVRWQFLEAIVRVSEACREPNEPLNWAVSRILEEHLAMLGEKLWTEILVFRSVLFTDYLDEIFKQHLTPLKSTFDFFAGRHSTQASKGSAAVRMHKKGGETHGECMSLSEWEEYVHQLHLVDARFSDRMTGYALALAAAVQSDEACTVAHMELRFPEFLMALGYVMFVRAGGVQGAGKLADTMEQCFTGQLEVLHRKTLEWSGSPLLARLTGEEGGRLRGWRVTVPWLLEMLRFLQRLYRVADDDLDGELSLRELSLALCQEEFRQELAALGVEVAHVSEFFQMADRDSSGAISLCECLHGFARVKERLKSDERALEFLRSTFGINMLGAGHDGHGDQSGHADYDPEQEITAQAVAQAAANPMVQAKMQHYGLYFDLSEFWEYLTQEAKKEKPRPKTITLEMMLNGYISFRDPRRMGDKAAHFLVEMFQQGDLDDSGSLTKKEFLDLLGKKENIDAMQRLGLLEGVTDKESLEMLFRRVDDDHSGEITIDEMLQWFLNVREIIRQRELEDRFFKVAMQTSNAEKGKRPTSAKGMRPRSATGTRTDLFGGGH